MRIQCQKKFRMPDPIRARPARGSAQRVRTGNRTLVACISCKDRKQRCDGQIPACSNCRRSSLVCLVEDPATKRHHPRNYLEMLEQRIIVLEGMLQEARSNNAGDSVPAPNEPPIVNPGQVSSIVVDDDRHELNDLSSMIGTLSLNAAGSEPSYLGPSSAFAFARFMKPSLRQVVSSLSPDLSRQHPDGPGTPIPEPCPLPDYHTAVKLSNAYFQNIHPQYPFLHEPTFRAWEATLKDPFGALSGLDYNPVSLYFLNMVYAVGAILLPSAGYSAEQLYVSAMLYIDDILCHDNLQCIQAILCCGAYSLRSSKGTSHWKLGGHALRQCVNLGYHRNQKRLKSTVDPLQQELQKRAFWSAYVMECSAAVMLGRPLSLHFAEIDAEYPVDIEDSSLSNTGINGSPRSSPSSPPTLMTHAIHGFRIRSLIGCIQTALYSDSTTTADPSIRKTRVQDLSLSLEKWRSSTPSPMIPPSGGALSYFVTPDWYETNYNYAILQLYRVQITDGKDPAPDEIFLKCLDAAKAICHSYRRQFFGKPITYTWSALHELFLAGLTYLYCLWTSPAAREASRYDQVSSACTDCTMVLVILGERWKDAAPYRDVFDALASRTMTMMADLQQGRRAEETAFVGGGDMYPEDLPEWVAGIEESGISIGVDWLLSNLIDDSTVQAHYVI